MATVKELNATIRPKAGKGAARAERRAGRVPGVIYGDSKTPLAISLDNAELKKRIYAGRFLTSIYDIAIDGQKHRVIPRDYQLHPLTDQPVHVDFMRLGEGAQIRVAIPIHVVGTEKSPGVKRGGTINIVVHTVDVRVSPEYIPEHIEVDVSDLEINHSRHLSQIDLPQGLTILSKSDITLVTVVPPSGYQEEIKAEAAAAATAAAAPAAGAAAAPAAGDKAEKK